MAVHLTGFAKNVSQVGDLIASNSGESFGFCAKMLDAGNGFNLSSPRGAGKECEYF